MVAVMGVGVLGAITSGWASAGKYGALGGRRPSRSSSSPPLASYGSSPPERGHNGHVHPGHSAVA
ncbi:MAG: NADH-quinone oxidoreductase subunit H, partial [Microbispora sp.]|nr:NADH-quinone oxidoreductase subunit H [Microbispora sp.]